MHCRLNTTGLTSVFAGLAFVPWLAAGQVAGQVASPQFPSAMQDGSSRESARQRRSQPVFGLAGGSMDGTYLRFADDIAKVLDDDAELRILPMVSRGAASNLQDLLYLRGTDAAFTQVDILEYFRAQRKIPDIDNRIQYIVRMPVAELHVAARADIRTIDDLRGQKVVFGGPGTSSAITGPIVLQRLGIEVQPLFVDHANGLRMLTGGEVAAVLGVVSKPVDLFAKIPPGTGLHLLGVPFSKALADLYTVGDFTSADYPGLVPAGLRVDTLAVPSVLAVLNTRGGDAGRRQRVERFVSRLFASWDRLLQPPYHPRWRDVNLAATVPGWTRAAAAEEMLQHVAKSAPDDAPSLRDFEAYVSREVHTLPRTDAEREAIFRQFMNWREQQRSKP